MDQADHRILMHEEKVDARDDKVRKDKSLSSMMVEPCHDKNIGKHMYNKGERYLRAY